MRSRVRLPHPALDFSTLTRWAARHIRRGIGTIAVERLDRDDIATWLKALAQGGQLSRRSIQIVRMTLRAALAAAVDAGDLRRNAAARVPMPRDVARRPKSKEADAWDDDQLDRFLETGREHRWDGPIRLEASMGRVPRLTSHLGEVRSRRPQIYGLTVG